MITDDNNTVDVVSPSNVQQQPFGNFAQQGDVSQTAVKPTVNENFDDLDFGMLDSLGVTKLNSNPNYEFTGETAIGNKLVNGDTIKYVSTLLSSNTRLHNIIVRAKGQTYSFKLRGSTDGITLGTVIRFGIYRCINPIPEGSFWMSNGKLARGEQERIEMLAQGHTEVNKATPVQLGHTKCYAEVVG